MIIALMSVDLECFYIISLHTGMAKPSISSGLERLFSHILSYCFTSSHSLFNVLLLGLKS